MTLTLEPEGKAQVTAFKTITEGCVGSEVLAKCKLKTDTPLNLPWTVDLAATQAVITNLELQHVFEGEKCFYGGHVLRFKEVTAKPDDLMAATSFTLSGVGLASETIPVAITGKLFFEPEQWGTYGVG